MFGKIDCRRLAGLASVTLIGVAGALMALGGINSITNPFLWLLGAILCALWAIYNVLAEMLEVQHVTGEIVGELIDLASSPPEIEAKTVTAKQFYNGGHRQN